MLRTELCWLEYQQLEDCVVHESESGNGWSCFQWQDHVPFFFFGSRRNRFLKQAHPSGFVWNLSVRGTWSKHILVVGTLRLDQTEINMCTRWLGSGYLLCGAWMLITQFVGCWVLSKNFCAGWLNICYLETLVHICGLGCLQRLDYLG